MAFQYVARVRALQNRFGVLSHSTPSGRAFKKLCLITLSSEVAREHVEYDPFPECVMCGVEGIRVDDIRVLPKAERFAGMTTRPTAASGSAGFHPPSSQAQTVTSRAATSAGAL